MDMCRQTTWAPNEQEWDLLGFVGVSANVAMSISGNLTEKISGEYVCSCVRADTPTGVLLWSRPSLKTTNVFSLQNTGAMGKLLESPIIR
jgi:hypothetical protein